MAVQGGDTHSKIHFGCAEQKSRLKGRLPPILAAPQEADPPHFHGLRCLEEPLPYTTAVRKVVRDRLTFRSTGRQWIEPPARLGTSPTFRCQLSESSVSRDFMESIPRYLHFQRLRTTVIRHLPAGKKLSKKPRWETPSELKVQEERQKAFHAESQSSQRKELIRYKKACFDRAGRSRRRRLPGLR
jgi:hypothetical protein